MRITLSARVAQSLFGLALAGFSIFSVSCSRSSPPTEREITRRFQAIDSLRTLGQYDEALRLSQSLETLTSGGAGRPWQAEDARRLGRTLATIAALPPEARRELARADSLTPVILKLLGEGDDFIAATEAASLQLELRSRYLGHDHPEVADAFDRLGHISQQAREYGSADEYLDRALALRRAALGPNHPKVAETLRHRGVLFKELHRRDEAESCYQGAISILESSVPADDPALADALQALGSFRRMAGRFDEAEALYTRALRMNRLNSGPRSVAVSDNLLWLGFSQLCAGKLESAETSLLEARAILLERNMDRTHAMGDVTWFLAKGRWLRDDNRGAVRWWRDCFLCQTNTRASHAQGYGLANLRGLVGEWVDALLCEGREAEAWGEVCRGSAQAAQSLLDLSAACRKAGAESVTLDSLRAEVLTLRGRAASENGSDSSPYEIAAVHRDPPDRVRLDPLRVRLARVDAERMVLERDIMTRFGEANVESLTVGRVQARLRPDQAMLGWIVGNWSYRGQAQKRSIWAYVLRDTGSVQWIHIGRWRNAEQAYRAWSGSFDRFDKIILRSSQWPHRVARDPDLDALARDAWEKMASPLMPYLKGAAELIIIQGQSRPLWPINIAPECFVDRQGRLMSQRFAFSYTPSPRIFVQLAEAAETRRAAGPRRVIALADPLGGPGAPLMAPLDTAWGTLARDAAAGSGPTIVDPALLRSALSGDREAIRRLPTLPSSRTEVLKLASVFPAARVLMGPDAGAAALEAILKTNSSLEILHLATHALIDDEEPGRSAFVMSIDRSDSRAGLSPAPPGSDLITADEVLMTWKLNADLVTLSGCQTGRGTWTRGGEDMGFEQAFLAAGARSLLMSRWKVEDRATALLMGRFYENLAGRHTQRRDSLNDAPMSRVSALQEAQSWLRNLKDRDGQAPFAHPAYWAGFVLVGNAE